MESMILNVNDLADNSNEPKELKLQDIDVWTKEELLGFIIKHHISPLLKDLEK